jgi:tyrosyl-DNA phosphodiesterase 2
MAFISHFRTQILSWWQDTPLPAGAAATFQAWHEFDEVGNRWRAVEKERENSEMTASPNDGDRQGATDWSYSLVTWNVDYSSPFSGQRLSAILAHTLSLSPAIDIIFLQELSREAFLLLLDEPQIRQGWFLTDADGILPAGQSFTTITLLSKARFQSPNPGPVWRVKYPSRFERDALCCDVFATPAPGRPGARLRLVNVHLDSLPIQPSLRPQQVSIAAALLRSAGRGVVAGDFNPVLPADDTLVQDNGLIDAWVELHPEDSGFTWGVDGKEPFPPNRMDKVAVLGLRVQHVKILSPGYIPRAKDVGELNDDDMVAWSDHSGNTWCLGHHERFSPYIIILHGI